MDYTVRNPGRITTTGLASSHFARRYFGNRISFSSSAYLDVSVQRVSLRMAMYSPYDDCALCSRVSPFGNLRVNRIFAPNRSLSQLITSFFGSWCQGIHPTLLLAWPSLEGFQSNYMSLSLLRKNHSSFKIAITFNILKTFFSLSHLLDIQNLILY